jgi:cytochrome c553
MPNRLSVALLSAALAFAAHAQEKKAEPRVNAPAHKDQPAAGGKLENNHAICIGCHGIPGYKTAFPEVYHVPRIAGQQPGYIVSALKAYKSGQRSHPSMRGIAASLTEEQMKQLADFYGAPAK